MEKTLLLIMIECCLAEKERLAQWTLNSGMHNQALVEGLKDCKQHFQEITNHPLFESLSLPMRSKVNSNSRYLSRLNNSFRQLQLPVESERKTTYQVPCPSDLLAMRSFCAGSSDNQMQRLTKICSKISKESEGISLIETNSSMTTCWVDRLPWQIIFQAIRRNDPDLALAAFKAIPTANRVFGALLKAHSADYLMTLIIACTELSGDETKQFDQDVICGQLTFELLLNDLLTTLEQRRDLNFCFGLPTHHARREQAAGFCLINKVAVIMAYEQLTADHAFHAIIIGMDVNRDDGLNAILMDEDFNQSFTHIDIYDSRVYPWDKISSINKQLQFDGIQEDGMAVWQSEAKCYTSIDLAYYQRKDADYHPAIILALERLEKLLEDLTQRDEKIILFLPTGWDSHYEEKASCGRWINQSTFLSRAQSLQCRFTDEDFNYFNQQLISLLECYPSSVLRLYWQLEGGYTDRVIERQIENLTATLCFASSKHNNNIM